MRTDRERVEEQAIRDAFKDRPTIETLIERGEIDPQRIMTASAEESLLNILAALAKARRERGATLSEVARRSGIDVAALSRLEAGKNPNPTFETLSRFADALGLRLELLLVEARANAWSDRAD